MGRETPIKANNIAAFIGEQWVSRAAGVMRMERRRMKVLRKEIGTEFCLVDEIVKSRMK